MTLFFDDKLCKIVTACNHSINRWNYVNIMFFCGVGRGPEWICWFVLVWGHYFDILMRFYITIYSCEINCRYTESVKSRNFELGGPRKWKLHCEIHSVLFLHHRKTLYSRFLDDLTSGNRPLLFYTVCTAHLLHHEVLQGRLLISAVMRMGYKENGKPVKA